jgi:hypothetical protein
MTSATSRTFSGEDAGRRGVRLAGRAVIGTATAAVFLGMATLSASAAPGDTSTGSVDANVNVNSTISLALDQSGFDLNGTPNSTVTKTGAVTGKVTTNNATGYSVGVQAGTATLQPATSGNTDSIPIANLKVANVAGTYTALSSTAPVITSTKSTRSALAGDEFSNNYRVDIPDVNSDTYTVTLNYTATALA